MSCDDCKDKDNAVNIILSIDGQEYTVAWCDNCAHQHGFHSPFEEKPFPLNNIIASVTNTEIDTQKNLPAKYDNVANPVCPNCGLTFHSLLEQGRIGCANCYSAFGKPMEMLLEKIHGASAHTGRKVKVEPIKKRTPVKAKVNREEKLHLELKKAIEQEDYEHAAELRDKLQALKTVKSHA